MVSRAWPTPSSQTARSIVATPFSRATFSTSSLVMSRMKPAGTRLRRATASAVSWLVDEMTARFPGTAREFWYVSDGGHFENMGAYELIRRRVKLILAVDGGADSKLEFEDLANAVERVRVDFGVKIDFEAELPRHPTGKLYKRLLRDEYWQGHDSRIV